MTEVLLARLDDITAAAAGAIATASNVGTVGTGVFKQKVGTNAEFYKLNAASARATIVLNGTDRIDFDVVEAQILLQNLGGALSVGQQNAITISNLAGSLAIGQVPNDLITYAKIQNVSAASRILGRGSAAGAGDVEEISIGVSFVMNTTTLERAALTGDVTASQNSNATTIAANAVTNAKMAQMAAGTTKGRATGAGTGDPTDLTQAQLQVNAGFYPYSPAPGGRLTLTTALSVTSSDVTAAATIYYALHNHGFVSIYDGTNWASLEYTELSLPLDSNSGHTGYHQSGKNFDLFLYVDSGTLRLASGPAWTNDTTRADALTRKNGRIVNNASITLRFGTASGDTVSAAANRALYVGTFRASADGQTEDSAAKRFLWNNYNRVARHARNAPETSNGWGYTTATIRQANANTANKFEYVRGTAEDEVSAYVQASAQNTNAGTVVQVGVGLDSTSAFATGFHNPLQSCAVANQQFAFFGSWRGCPGIGYHYCAWLEWSQAIGTTTWTGDFGDATLFQCGISGQVFA